jgi:glycosyltransferase involved in cell wall biosynthesis
MSISLIIPTYKNPTYLDLCLKSATENTTMPDTEIIVIVDGFPELSNPVLEKYKNETKLNCLVLEKNAGMATALNLGVSQASNRFVYIINDDNVLPRNWDAIASDDMEYLSNKHVDYDGNFIHVDYVITYQQIEPHRSIFNFAIDNLGTTAEGFLPNYNKFLDEADALSISRLYEETGKIFPFLISKKNYMMVGGFDSWYRSPFWVDVDFWLKLELVGAINFVRSMSMHVYHFGSRATKHGPEGHAFRISESTAAQQFNYKWGYVPDIMNNTRRGNTKLPNNNIVPRGVS